MSTSYPGYFHTLVPWPGYEVASTFRAKALRQEVSNMGQGKRICFYTSGCTRDYVTKINQSDGFRKNNA
jgi:hypothetical protein